MERDMIRLESESMHTQNAILRQELEERTRQVVDLELRIAALEAQLKTRE